jgi:hypothetical protein
MTSAYGSDPTPESLEQRIAHVARVQHGLILWDPVPLADLTAGRVSTEGCVRLAALLHGAGRSAVSNV